MRIEIFLRKLTVIGIMALSVATSYAQNKTLNFILSDTASAETFKSLKKELSPKTIVENEAAAKREARQFLLKLQGNGYLTASIDTLYCDSTKCSAILFLGQQYQWATLSKGNAEQFLTGTGFRQKLYSGKTFNLQQIQQLQQNILKNCENNGYPFASISFDSVQITDGRIQARLNLQRNQLVRFDSIVIAKPVVASVYLYNYIGIKPGDLYNESQVNRISNRLKELPFLSEKRPFEIIFGETETRLNLFPAAKKASQFDGVIGVLPDNNTGKITLTGEAHLKLQNALRRGEIIELNWKQLPNRTQDLKVHGLYPFLLNTPIGLDGVFTIYKKDTIYLEVVRNIGVQYQFTGNNFLKAFLNNKESSLLSTEGFQNYTVLPAYADISITSYGLTMHYEKLDYRFNPRQGFLVEMSGSTGNRIITRNPSLKEELYNNVDLKTAQYHLNFTGDYFLPLGQRHVVDIGNITGWLYSPEIFDNELFRIGGLKSLRGFDEESILASSFTIGKLEYRYLLEQNSFLFTFFNMAYYENRSRNKFIHDTPFGFGTGINFDTKLGIMSVSYALGKEFNNPIFFRNGKIHFGIVSYF